MTDAEWRRFAAVGGLDQFRRWPGRGMVVDDFGHIRPVPDVSEMSMPVRCVHCQHVYDAGKVTVVQRYADCSMWKCPGCQLLVDDRLPPWGIRHYYELDEDGREKR